MTTANQQSLYDLLVSKGIPAGNAAVAVGVLSAESGANLNTGAQNNSGTDASGALSNGQGAFGIASWNGSRQQDLLNFAGDAQSAGNLQTQGNFFLSELQNKYPTVYQSLTNPGVNPTALATTLVTQYENPAATNVQGEISSAMQYAGQIGAGPQMSNSQFDAANGGTTASGVGGIIDKVTGAPSALLGWITNFFTRGIVVLLGIVLILGALYMLAQRNG
jgi:hypothetical protein